MHGKWNDVACNQERMALCQAPLDWILIGDYLYLIGDAIDKGPMSFWKARDFCQNYDFEIFEPRTVEVQTSVLAKIPTEHSSKKFWINAMFSYLANE